MEITKNKVVGAVLSYLLVWLLLVSVDSTIGIVQEGFYKQKDHDYWANYIAVEPAQPTFTYGEPIRFISTVEQKRPTGFRWNDILFCNTEHSNGFEYFTNYESSRTKTILEEPGVEINGWKYGNQNTKLPPPGAECYILSEITYVPEEHRQYRRTYQ